MLKDGHLHFATQSDCDKFIQRARKASKSQLVARKAPTTDECIGKLKAKIKRLERQNKGLAERLVELQANYDGLMIAYELMRDTTVDKQDEFMEMHYVARLEMK